MSGPAEEKGGKSSKMPTLITPALTMSSSSSAAAGRAARTRASAKTMPGARARRRDNDFFMGPPREGEARERAAGTSFAGNAGAYNRRPGACPSPALRPHCGREPPRRKPGDGPDPQGREGEGRAGGDPLTRLAV